MITPLLSRSVATLLGHQTNTGYLSICNSRERPALDEESKLCVMPIGGKIGGWRITLSVAPGAGKSWKFTLRKNFVDTAISITISGSDTTGSALYSSDTFVAEDLYSIRLDPTNTPATTTFWYTLLISATESVCLMGAGFDAIPNYLPASSSAFLPITGESYNGFVSNTPTASDVLDHSHICPIDGTAKNLTVWLSVTPGGSDTRVFKLYREGLGTPLSVTIEDPFTTGKDTSSSVAISQTDRIALLATRTGGISTPRPLYAISMTIAPTTANRFAYFSMSTDYSATRYQHAHGLFLVGSNEADFLYKSERIDFFSIGARISEAPGGVESRTFTLRKNSADTPLSIQLSGLAQEGLLLADTTFLQDDDMSVQYKESSTSAVNLADGLQVSLEARYGGTDPFDDGRDRRYFFDAPQSGGNTLGLCS